MEENASDEAADAFLEVWPKLKAYIDDNYTRETEDGLQRLTPGQIDERTEYRMDIYNSVTDADMAFLNAGRYEEGVRVLGEILQTFAWEKDEDASIRGGIGDCLERSGKKGEADKWFEAWLSERPKDPHCANYYVMALMDRGEGSHGLSSGRAAGRRAIRRYLHAGGGVLLCERRSGKGKGIYRTE